MIPILMIDDDVELTPPLKTYFEKFDITLEHAAEPISGLDKIKQGNFKLIILDIMLPVMDGFEVCRKIREFSQIPIIMLTARGEVTDRIVGLELGADDYLSKPFEPRELVARIKRILKRAKTDISHTDGPLQINKSKQTVTLDKKEF